MTDDNVPVWVWESCWWDQFDEPAWKAHPTMQDALAHARKLRKEGRIGVFVHEACDELQETRNRIEVP